jgi:hypothetical protein
MTLRIFDYLVPTASRRTDRPRSVTWKVIKLDSPMTKEIGLDVEYGVVISADKMLERAQTLLFCPLISGVTKDGMLMEPMPWHVEVEIEDDRPGRLARIDYGKLYLSTKIVLPIARNEIDGDGKSRGWLKAKSQKLAAEKLREWLPSFKDIAAGRLLAR